ncbi:MAG: phage tail family protein [Terrisporobacter sp.]
MHKLIYRNSRGQEVILSNSRPFLLVNIDNYSNVSTNISTSDNTVDGLSITNVSIKEKVLPVEGDIIGYSKEDLDRRRLELSSIFNPKLDGELIYQNNAFTRKVNCMIQDISFNRNEGNSQMFLVQFICPNPFWMDLYTKKEEVALWQGDLEFELELTEAGSEMGRRVSNLICNVYNSGDVECGMKIQFKALATVVDPSLFNINSREFIKINKTLERGDVLEVSTYFDNKRIDLIRSDGTKTNVFNWIDLDSEFLQLELGDNLFRYDAVSGIDNLEVAIYYNLLYMGV